MKKKKELKAFFLFYLFNIILKEKRKLIRINKGKDMGVIVKQFSSQFLGWKEFEETLKVVQIK